MIGKRGGLATKQGTGSQASRRQAPKQVRGGHASRGWACKYVYSSVVSSGFAGSHFANSDLTRNSVASSGSTNPAFVECDVDFVLP